MVERLLWGYWGGGRITLLGVIGVGFVVAEDEVVVIIGVIVVLDVVIFFILDIILELFGRLLFSRVWRKMLFDVVIFLIW